jgi:ubiquinone/menaquinone biosynthesis C-methylase UbiE
MSLNNKIKVAKSNDTVQFYDKIIDGEQPHQMWGEARFNPELILKDPSTKKYFIDIISPFLKGSDKVLDFGCGPGSFLCAAAPFCKEIVGVDISKKFTERSQAMIQSFQLPHAKTVHIQPDQLPFENDSFDALLMVDIIHHLEDAEKSLKEVFRVLRPKGRVLIYEPNKLNPLIYVMHFMDPFERGLLKYGTPGIYRRLLSQLMEVQDIQFNGIVVGPQSKAFRMISDALNHPATKPFIGWLNPKMFITGIKH